MFDDKKGDMMKDIFDGEKRKEVVKINEEENTEVQENTDKVKEMFEGEAPIKKQEVFLILF